MDTIQARVYRAVQRRGRLGCHPRDIVDEVYANAADGGPMCAANAIRVTAHRMKAKGLIYSVGGGWSSRYFCVEQDKETMAKSNPATWNVLIAREGSHELFRPVGIADGVLTSVDHHEAQCRAAYDLAVKRRDVIAVFLYAPDGTTVQYTFCKA